MTASADLKRRGRRPSGPRRRLRKGRRAPSEAPSGPSVPRTFPGRRGRPPRGSEDGERPWRKSWRRDRAFLRPDCPTGLRGRRRTRGRTTAPKRPSILSSSPFSRFSRTFRTAGRTGASAPEPDRRRCGIRRTGRRSPIGRLRSASVRRGPGRSRRSRSRRRPPAACGSRLTPRPQGRRSRRERRD